MCLPVTQGQVPEKLKLNRFRRVHNQGNGARGTVQQFTFVEQREGHNCVAVIRDGREKIKINGYTMAKSQGNSSAAIQNKC